jgi:hypothetical protein
MPRANTCTEAVLADWSFASILERTKLSTASVAMVRIMAATIKRVFFLRMLSLSPKSGPLGSSLNDLTLRQRKGPAPPLQNVSISVRGHKYKDGRYLETCTQGQKKGNCVVQATSAKAQYGSGSPTRLETPAWSLKAGLEVDMLRELSRGGGSPLQEGP